MLNRTITSKPSTAEHAARYEILRNHVMERHGLVARHGFAVLLLQGVAAWMDAWSKVPAPPPRSANDESPWPCPLPDGSTEELVRMLAAMTLGHMQKVRT